MTSPKDTLYWTQITSIAEEILHVTNEWLVPHNIDNVDLLHRLGDDKEDVVNHFDMLQLAMMKAAEIHGVSESETTADIWNLMNQEHTNELTSKGSLPKPN